MIDAIPLSAGLGAAVASALGVLIIAWPGTRRAAALPALPFVPRGQSVILLRDGQVIDTSADVTPESVGIDLVGVDWSYLRALLVDRFPGLPEQPPRQAMAIGADDGSDSELRLEPSGTALRLVLDAALPGAAEQHCQTLRSAEQHRLWAVMDCCPHPVWMTNRDDRVIWSNPAFAALCRDMGQDDDTRGPFDLRTLTKTDPHSEARVSLEHGNGTRHWYEVSSTLTSQGCAHIATSIDTLIDAENAQRNFVQTLTKTFAHLTTGLAVFDKQHRLVLFNPALLDLTGLSVDFLSARPSLTGFFDQLREARILPEPKNYNDWRDNLAEVVAAAQDDRYSETWNLPTGLTYSVVGRPHPDGALAFLIEDISAEISLTRRFRAELELSQSVFDRFDEAVVVFNRSGVLIFCNAGYKDMWKRDPSTAFAATGIVDATQSWREGCKPALVWSEICDFVLHMSERASWETELELLDGTPLICLTEPLTGGSTLIRFQRRTGAAPRPVAAKDTAGA